MHRKQYHNIKSLQFEANIFYKIPRVTPIIYKATGLLSFLGEIFKTKNLITIKVLRTVSFSCYSQNDSDQINVQYEASGSKFW